jgi:hypothetical protein
MIITYVNNKQVPFIAQVSIIPYGLGYESAKYLLYQGYTT